ncbi:hypothetical protein [Geodermatophilus chilensis]|uniref:hypothetical protein n=1 Tax=Geodermatophilus chilensis TaxID=2035835 RepID=UPI000C2692D6|nr:hypothetical protein [Geodermatophilus chilensis]
MTARRPRTPRDPAEEERRARSDLYTGIARAVQVVGLYGGYEDIPHLMAEYDPAELNPPECARAFEIDNLRAAARFVAELIAWAEAREARLRCPTCGWMRPDETRGAR